MENTLGPTPRIGGRSTSGAEFGAELSTLLRTGRTSLQNVQTGLNKVLTLEPSTTVKDLVIVGDGPAAEEIFRYCEDQTVRGYRFRGIFNDEPIDGLLGERRVGDVEAVKSFAIQNRIDILYCALPGTRITSASALFIMRKHLLLLFLPPKRSINVLDAAVVVTASVFYGSGEI